MVHSAARTFVKFEDDPFLRVIESSSCPPALLSELLHAPTFETSQLTSAATALSALRSVASLVLPPQLDGDIVWYDAPVVVLLRGRLGGSLDYAIRFRDGAGRLRIPGGGPLVSTVGGKRKQQRVRSYQHELDIARRIVDRLDLPLDASNRWMESAPTMREALQIVESFQRIATETSREVATGDPDAVPIELMWAGGDGAKINVVGSLSPANVKVEVSKKRNWFGVGGNVKMGQTEMAFADLLAALPDGEGDIEGDFVKLGDGNWAKIERRLRERLQRLKDAADIERGQLRIDATAAREMRALAEQHVEFEAASAWDETLSRMADSEGLDPTVDPSIDATLRPYQRDGFRWMAKLAHWGVGAVLADDMGLGKTLQTLCVLVRRAADGPTLVIAPTSVGFNWVRETERFAPTMNVHLYRETDRAAFVQTVGPNDLVVCSYGLALRDAETLGSVKWHTLVLDEAQAIKNSRSKTARAIAGLDVDWAVALTGTPIENHLGELWSLFRAVSPGVLGGWDRFRDRYAGPIERDGDAEAREALSRRLRPFILRRTKSEVLTDLPPRTEMTRYVDLSHEERKRYEEIRRDAIDEIQKSRRDAAESDKPTDQRFQILAAMTRLRQMACHPALVDEAYVGDSAKLQCIIETLSELKSEGHRALVFSQFTSHLAIIRDAIMDAGMTHEYLDGSTPAAARMAAVDRFQCGHTDCFLISLKAGGTGLNLTAADYVLHVDPWWNPAVEDQATDRAHRIGQDKPVMVYRIVARGTIEEEILKMHGEKRELADSIIQGTAAAAKLSTDDLIGLIAGE